MIRLDTPTRTHTAIRGDHFKKKKENKSTEELSEKETNYTQRYFCMIHRHNSRKKKERPEIFRTATEKNRKTQIIFPKLRLKNRKRVNVKSE